MKYLIVNADDFGLHESINAGIIKGYQEGLITSTSLMCSAEAFDDAVKLAKENSGLGIGIHLTLVGGVKPLLASDKIPSLVDASGVFPENYTVFIKKFFSGKVAKNEIKAELSAQIEKALETGLNITHVDSHQHLHVLPGITSIVIELCKKYGIKRIRMPAESIFYSGGYNTSLGRKIGRAGLTFCTYLAELQAQKAGFVYPNNFFGMLAGGNLNEKLVEKMIYAMPTGVTEVMTHPGVNDELLRQKFTWGYHWTCELAAFLSAKNKKEIKASGIVLINFGGLDNAK